MTANAAERLIQHYVDNFRVLPWRSPPGEQPPDPYRVWLSEIMLQQTTVATVTPRFERFVMRWPTVDALSIASDEDVLQEWAGLGYYARARNLIACAREVVRLGGFPSSADELRKLPGIGDYTAGAIAAIAFGHRAAAVDTNVSRVLARLCAIPHPQRPELERYMVSMMPPDRPGDLGQAMMDLGATICRAKAPRCEICPLREHCRANAIGTPEQFPARQMRPPRPHKRGVAWWIEQDGHVWLVRRPRKGLLGGMAALPGSDWNLPAHSGPLLGTVRHVFTHFSLDLDVVLATEPSGAGWWQPLDLIHEAGLPTLYRKAVAAVMDAQVRRAA